MSDLEPGWMQRQVDAAKKDYETWPEWMKRAFTPAPSEPEPSHPNHYDKDGYCDNPNRGY